MKLNIIILLIVTAVVLEGYFYFNLIGKQHINRFDAEIKFIASGLEKIEKQTASALNVMYNFRSIKPEDSSKLELIEKSMIIINENINISRTIESGTYNKSDIKKLIDKNIDDFNLFISKDHKIEGHKFDNIANKEIIESLKELNEIKLFDINYDSEKKDIVLCRLAKIRLIMYNYIIVNMGCKCFYKWPQAKILSEKSYIRGQDAEISMMYYVRTGLYSGPFMLNDELHHAYHGIAYINSSSDSITISFDSEQFSSFLYKPDGSKEKIVKKVKVTE